MTRALILSLVALSTLAACGKNNNAFGNRQAFDGQYFRVRVSAERDDKAQFTVTVHDATRSLVGARDAAITKVSEHCIKLSGRSDRTWEISPEVPDEDLPIINGDLILKGTCDGWQ
jgi:hypothetical protein